MKLICSECKQLQDTTQFSKRQFDLQTQRKCLSCINELKSEIFCSSCQKTKNKSVFSKGQRKPGGKCKMCFTDNDNKETKQKCSNCKEQKFRDQFHKNDLIYEKICKNCRNNEKMFRCKHCGVLKEANRFSGNERMENGICKECYDNPGSDQDHPPYQEMDMNIVEPPPTFPFIHVDNHVRVGRDLYATGVFKN